jgi:uncharacterized SAM-binding protein YcdF (DUF218 family)
VSIVQRIIRGLGVLSMLFFVITTLTPASDIVSRWFAVPENIQPSDAIVVLGAGLLHQGMLPEESLRRLVRGITLYKQGMAPLLVVDGNPRPDDPNLSEAEVRSRLARTMGIPSDAIVKQETSTSTIEESKLIATLLHPRNVHRIILVTDPFHMHRAKLVFERAGFEVMPATSADYPAVMRSPRDRLWLAVRVTQESAALVYYRLAGYF